MFYTLFCVTIMSLFYTLLLFLVEQKIFKSPIWDAHWTSTGPGCGTSGGPNNETFWERPRDVGHISFLNSTHIKLTLTGYSTLYSELR